MIEGSLPSSQLFVFEGPTCRDFGAVPAMLGRIMGITVRYFFCAREEFSAKVPGWLFPTPNLAEPVRATAKNPFTGEQLDTIEYRASDQPDPPEESDHEAVWEMPSFSHPGIQPDDIGKIVSAIDGRDSAELAAQIFDQELISDGKAEDSIMLIPKNIWLCIASLDEEGVTACAEAWGTPVPPDRPKKGFFARLFGSNTPEPPAPQEPIEVYIELLSEFRDFTRRAQQNGGELFLLMGP